MSISALNSVSFNGKRENIDAFINLDDNAIRQVAMAKTRQNVDFDAHKKRSAALLLSLPVAEGLATAAFAPKGLRRGAFIGGTATGALFWGGMLGTFALLSAIKNKNDKVDNFVEKHPFISFVGSAVAAYFGGRGLAVGGTKLFNKAIGTKAYENLATKSAEMFKTVKANKYVARGLEKLGNARKVVVNYVKGLPSALKETAKTFAYFAPMFAVIGTLAESINFRKTVTGEFNYNYADLKEKQLNLARHRNAELNV